jgi:hypothetical protein
MMLLTSALMAMCLGFSRAATQLTNPTLPAFFSKSLTNTAVTNYDGGRTLCVVPGTDVSCLEYGNCPFSATLSYTKGMYSMVMFGGLAVVHQELVNITTDQWSNLAYADNNTLLPYDYFDVQTQVKTGLNASTYDMMPYETTVAGKAFIAVHPLGYGTYGLDVLAAANMSYILYAVNFSADADLSVGIKILRVNKGADWDTTYVYAGWADPTTMEYASNLGSNVSKVVDFGKFCVSTAADETCSQYQSCDDLGQISMNNGGNKPTEITLGNVGNTAMTWFQLPSSVDINTLAFDRNTVQFTGASGINTVELKNALTNFTTGGGATWNSFPSTAGGKFIVRLFDPSKAPADANYTYGVYYFNATAKALNESASYTLQDVMIGIAYFDSNGDSTINAAEFAVLQATSGPTFAGVTFAMVDTNNDGELTAQELMVALQAATIANAGPSGYVLNRTESLIAVEVSAQSPNVVVRWRPVFLCTQEKVSDLCFGSGSPLEPLTETPTAAPAATTAAPSSNAGSFAQPVVWMIFAIFTLLPIAMMMM